ncbi:MAG: hypothetical protein ACJ757_12580 [Gaiellaceae bacterium]
MRWWAALVVAVASLAATGAAGAVGPWPGLAATVSSADHSVRYTASRADGGTTIRAISHGAVTAELHVDGAWGIPAVTSVGLAGGLSPDGRLLILTQPVTYQGLRAESSFLIVRTPKLSVPETITLPGEFGFDAVSPDRHTLYVIQHRNTSDLVQYVVRAYDLVKRALVRRAVVAKGEGETMRGYPVSRATSKSGAWVYTLYNRPSGKPFIHALNTSRRFAVCIDLTWSPSSSELWNTRLALTADGRKLLVRSHNAVVSRVDTRSYRVS